ncbi:protein spinster homolog 1 isoform X2 [Erinaceus europaeus]|uniref:Protein spinster homolog 1 isoform X2 n=1 Tax=Erinaceus europaeus TaxID=9365 RepID=A0ABM3VWK4_ERIEU|nr:protein spinster homolog 1 isoform X2 [Erinaceus europaeus]
MTRSPAVWCRLRGCAWAEAQPGFWAPAWGGGWLRSRGGERACPPASVPGATRIHTSPGRGCICGTGKRSRPCAASPTRSVLRASPEPPPGAPPRPGCPPSSPLQIPPLAARRMTRTTGRCPAPRGCRAPWGTRSPSIPRCRTGRGCSASRACLRAVRLSSWPCCATSTSSTTWTASPWPVSCPTSSSSLTSEIVVLASSRPRFWLLLLTRGLVGVGEASYSTIAPTLIADLFVADQRSRMLSVFYFAIPVGSGLGYIAGSKVKDMAGDWHWALRVTPGLGVVAVLLLFLVVREPPRGAVERHSDSPPLTPTSWWADLRALARNPSFILSSLGFTAVAFVTGSLALWAPAFLLRSRVVLGETPPCLPGDSCSSSDSLIFGLITCLTGVLGVGLGVEISRRLRRTNPRADPLVCAAGLLGSAPFLFLALACARGSIVATYIFIFVGETLLSMNWAIVADILLYVVIPTRRSTAEAFQIVLSHLLGDAGSPYLIGLISDRLRRAWPPSFLSEFRALQFSLMLCAFVGALGGAAFLGTAMVIEGDRRRAQLHVQGLLHEAGPDDRIVVPQRGRSTRVPVSSVLI